MYRTATTLAATPDQDMTEFVLRSIKEVRGDLTQSSSVFLTRILQLWCDKLHKNAFEVRVTTTFEGRRILPEEPASIGNRQRWRLLQE